MKLLSPSEESPGRVADEETEGRKQQRGDVNNSAWLMDLVSTQVW